MDEEKCEGVAELVKNEKQEGGKGAGERRLYKLIRKGKGVPNTGEKGSDENRSWGPRFGEKRGEKK